MDHVTLELDQRASCTQIYHRTYFLSLKRWGDDTLQVQPDTMNDGGGFNSAISPCREAQPANSSQYDFPLRPAE